jgi:hypothetical protein
MYASSAKFELGQPHLGGIRLIELQKPLYVLEFRRNSPQESDVALGHP